LLIAPIAKGPTRPPRFPKQLIRAIPIAAEEPARNSFGSDQKGPHKLKMPEATRHHRMTERKIDLDVVVPTRLNDAAEIINGMAAWYRRSDLRSELRPTRIITGSPTRYGITTSQPTVVFVDSWPESAFTS